jgi:hypothetical protein
MPEDDPKKPPHDKAPPLDPREPQTDASAGYSTMGAPVEDGVPDGGGRHQTSPALPGTSEPRYTDLGEIGRGGMGTVHRTLDGLLLREVATKTLSPAAAGSSAVARFVEEAQISGQLDHPHIVPVYDFGTNEQQQAYITMKLVSGQTLTEVIRSLHTGGLESEGLEQVLRIMLQVCEAVSFAHSRGVVHRDLKPANIMIGSHSQVYVMDWGLGMLLGEEQPSGAGEPSEPTDTIRTWAPGSGSGPAVAGTVAYMAPEQAAGRLDAIDFRTDVFGLGAILYEILTRQPPFLAHDTQAQLSLARSGNITPPQEIAGSRPLPPGLCEITQKALQQDPVDRYQTVDALREDLERLLRGGGWFSTRRFEAGHRIMREGEAGNAAYVITEGRCEVCQERPSGKQTLRILGPGDVFGEAALLSAQPRTATVSALEDVTVKVVTADAFERELGRSSWVAALVKQLSARFLELEGRLREAQSDDAAER